ncbi:hypothetical protein [Endozoicomonas ascidiicola]|uniref:hypothetical protein n=1 Tax=Endozoicomonas ascidiicola TaxID=1698521 RepID=UPI00082AD7B0|nr:hypothetical protein [Endozoicomonas ascidiicola]
MPSSHNSSVTADLIDLVFEKVQEIPDPRSQKGRSSNISISDFFMYALGVFHNKNSSLLACDDKREQPTIKENAKRLYHVERIPCDTYLRSIIDLVQIKHLRPLFLACFAYCQRRETKKVPIF